MAEDYKEIPLKEAVLSCEGLQSEYLCDKHKENDIKERSLELSFKKIGDVEENIEIKPGYTKVLFDKVDFLRNIKIHKTLHDKIKFVDLCVGGQLYDKIYYSEYDVLIHYYNNYTDYCIVNEDDYFIIPSEFLLRGLKRCHHEIVLVFFLKSEYNSESFNTTVRYENYDSENHYPVNFCDFLAGNQEEVNTRELNLHHNQYYDNPTGLRLNFNHPLRFISIEFETLPISDTLTLRIRFCNGNGFYHGDCNDKGNDKNDYLIKPKLMFKINNHYVYDLEYLNFSRLDNAVFIFGSDCKVKNINALNFQVLRYWGGMYGLAFSK
jgi:hypothetical protein